MRTNCARRALSAHRAHDDNLVFDTLVAIAIDHLLMPPSTSENRVPGMKRNLIYAFDDNVVNSLMADGMII